MRSSTSTPTSEKRREATEHSNARSTWSPYARFQFGSSCFAIWSHRLESKATCGLRNSTIPILRQLNPTRNLKPYGSEMDTDGAECLAAKEGVPPGNGLTPECAR